MTLHILWTFITDSAVGIACEWNKNVKNLSFYEYASIKMC